MTDADRAELAAFFKTNGFHEAADFTDEDRTDYLADFRKQAREAAPAAKPRTVKRRARDKKSDKKKSTSPFGYIYGGVPLVILGDPTLSANAVRASGLIAEKLFNFPRSKNRRREISYSELAEAMGVTAKTAIASVWQLRKRHYLELVTEGVGRRGNLYAFGEAVAMKRAA